MYIHLRWAKSHGWNIPQVTKNKYLFVWGLSSHLRIFHSYRDVTITGEGLQILTYAQHPWPLNTTCFYDLCLSRLGFEHPTFQGQRSNPLRHRRGQQINRQSVSNIIFNITV